MATFKLGDWVQITPTIDKRWEHWQDEHTAMAGHIGIIETIQEDEIDSSVTYFCVSLLDKGDRAYARAWFLEKHVIKSSKYDLKMSEQFEQACEELQIWEKKKKKMLDDSLKKAFGIYDNGKNSKKKLKKREKVSLASSDKSSQAQLVEGWEETTEEIDIDEIFEDISIEDLYDTVYLDGAD
jgi:hypothetical protein